MKLNSVGRVLKGAITSAATVLALGAAGGAQAALLVDNWTFDFRGLGGGAGLPNNPNYVINNIDQVGFIGAITQAIINDASGNGLPSVGETFTTTGFGNASEFKNDSTGTIGVPLLNVDGTFFGFPGFEVSFKFSTTGVFTSLSGNVGTFDHTSGVLQLYVDRLDDSATDKASAANGQGSFTDGTLFATFNYVADPQDGGSFDFVTGNGEDNLVLSYAGGIAGVIKDSGGNDLANGSLLAITGSDFDTNPSNTSAFSYTSPLFTCGNSAVNFCAVEDGSFVLAQQAVPEPNAMLLVGTALLALGYSARRTRKR